MIISGSGSIAAHLAPRAIAAPRTASPTTEPRRQAGAGLRPPRGSRGVADDLAAHIRSGRLPAGSRLPTYHALAQRYQVSVSTVQQAIALLNARGLTRGHRRCGVQVLENPYLVSGHRGR